MPPVLKPALAVLALVIVLVPLTPAGATKVPRCHGRRATIAAAGTVTGTPGDDVIVTASGNDHVRTGGGNDLVCSGRGSDTIEMTGPGNVTVYGGQGKDGTFVQSGGISVVFYGGRGADWLNAQGYPDAEVEVHSAKVQ
jgi:Ca2+-binding RTX toxin-like protein